MAKASINRRLYTHTHTIYIYNKGYNMSSPVVYYCARGSMAEGDGEGPLVCRGDVENGKLMIIALGD